MQFVIIGLDGTDDDAQARRYAVRSLHIQRGDVWRDITVHRSNTREPWQFNRPQEWFEKNLE